MTTTIAPPEGDDVHVEVRLVVAPCDGTFRPHLDPSTDDRPRAVEAGAVVGHVDGPGRTEPVTAFCAGRLVRVLAEPGERVRRSEPVAWIEPGPTAARTTR